MCVLDLWGRDGNGSLRSERSDGPTLPPAARPASVINIYKGYFKSRASQQSRSSSERDGEDTEKEDRERESARRTVREEERESNEEGRKELE